MLNIRNAFECTPFSMNTTNQGIVRDDYATDSVFYSTVDMNSNASSENGVTSVPSSDFLQTNDADLKLEEILTVGESAKSPANILTAAEASSVTVVPAAATAGSDAKAATEKLGLRADDSHDVTATGQSCVTASTGRSEEEERRLVLASVKHVDCQDFPFDEVLSLEETVFQEVASQSTKNKNLVTDLPTERKDAAMKESVCIEYMSHQALSASLNSPPLMKASKDSRRGRRNRPPLLKCATWPNQMQPDDEDVVQQKNPRSANVTNPDSPSFYSQSSIDFSAISHLAEEHDKRMAQEQSEMAQNQHPLISATTKEKLYGKATRSRGLAAQRKNLKENSCGARRTDSSLSARPSELRVTVDGASSAFSVFHSKQSSATQVNARRHTVGEPERSVIVPGKAKSSSTSMESSMRRTAKAVMSPLEKAFRKQYTMATKSGSGVVTPTLGSLSNAEAPVETGEDASKKGAQLPAEKHPLPPEGFKITRYPIKPVAAGSVASPSSESDTADEAALGNSDLHRVIRKLQKQAKEAEDRIASAEKQAKEWKEIAQQTLRAAQVIKSQMEFEKVRANCAEGRTPPGSASSSSDRDPSSQGREVPRRWSNDPPREGVTITRHRIVSGGATSSVVPMVKRNSSRGRKRSYNHQQPQQQQVKRVEAKRARVVSDPAINLQQSGAEKQESLIDWLTDTESQVNDVSFLSLLDSTSSPQSAAATPAAPSVKHHAPHIGLTGRSFSHEEVRAALRAKVEHSRLHPGVQILDDNTSAVGLRSSGSLSNPDLTLRTARSAQTENVDKYLTTANIHSRTAAPAAHSGKTLSANAPSFPESTFPPLNDIRREEDDMLSDLLLSDVEDNASYSPGEFSHSLSDSELHVSEKKSSHAAQLTKPKQLLSKKLSNSDGFLAGFQTCEPFHNHLLGGNVDQKSDADFLSQLDSILGF